MNDVLVGVFDSADHAHAAHATLLEHGVRCGQIGVQAGAPAAEETGLAGWVARMFSGFLPHDDPRGRAYAERVGRGGGIVAIHGLDEAARAEAAAILQRHGATGVATHAPSSDAMLREAHSAGSRAARELAAVTSVGPQAYVLPNAPTDWGRARRGSRASIGNAEDPARPEGELRDAIGLDPPADHPTPARRGRGS